MTIITIGEDAETLSQDLAGSDPIVSLLSLEDATKHLTSKGTEGINAIVVGENSFQEINRRALKKLFYTINDHNIWKPKVFVVTDESPRQTYETLAQEGMKISGTIGYDGKPSFV